MTSILGFVTGLLTAALSLLGFVQQHPELPQTQRDQAQQVATQAITQATNALSNASIQPAAPTQSSNRAAGDLSTFATPTTGAAPLTVTFIAPASAGGDFIYFGDGADGCSVPGVVRGELGCSVPSGTPITHTYTKSGVYQASVSRRLPSTTLTSATITVTDTAASNTGTISVPGMSKYTDTDFGFSFWYPSGWQVRQVPVQVANVYGNGTIVKQLMVALPGDTNFTQNAISVVEYYSADSSILVPPSCAKFTCVPTLVSFDKNAHKWMSQTQSSDIEGIGQNPPAVAADVSNNTMGGLHVFGNRVIPLSAHNFLDVSIWTGSGLTGQLLAKTVIATDPSVATPVSAQEQVKVIQAEKDAYAGQ